MGLMQTDKRFFFPIPKLAARAPDRPWSQMSHRFRSFENKFGCTRLCRILGLSPPALSHPKHVDSTVRPHDKTRYQGKNLAYLLLAICLPAALLFLRILFGVIAADLRITPEQSAYLVVIADVALALFFIAQLLCAVYLQRLVPPRPTRAGRALQYAGVLIMGLLFSITGAVMLEAFGLNVFLRAAGPH